MPKTQQANFTGGEIHELAHGRVDLQRYYNSVAELVNFRVNPLGPVHKSPGLRFVSEAPVAGQPMRLLHFKYNAEQTYMIGLSHQTARIYAAGAELPGVVLPLPYLGTEIFDVQFAQTGDRMWLAHNNHPTQELRRINPTTWSVTTFAPTAWPFSAPNWPGVVVLNGERLHFMRTPDNQAGWWASQVGNVDDFTSVADEAATGFERTLTQVGVIQWAADAKELLIGSTDNETVAKNVVDKLQTTTNSHTSHGSSPIRPVVSDLATLFVDGSGRQLRELTDSFEANGYQAPDMLQLASHLTGVGGVDASLPIRQLSYERVPFPLVHAVRSDGLLLQLTYDRPGNVVAWARRETAGAIESVGSIPVPGGTETYVVVRRTIQGVERRFIEMFDNTSNPDVVETSFYIDSGLSYSGAPQSTFTGLDHLEGEVVAINGNGATLPVKTVVGGSVTLDEPVSTAHIGLPYTSRLVSLPLPSTRGIPSGWGELYIDFWRSGGFYVNDDEIDLRDVIHDVNTAVPLQTGAVRAHQIGWDKDGVNTIESRDPQPLTIRGLFGTAEAGGG